MNEKAKGKLLTQNTMEHILTGHTKSEVSAYPSACIPNCEHSHCLLSNYLLRKYCVTLFLGTKKYNGKQNKLNPGRRRQILNRYANKYIIYSVKGVREGVVDAVLN